MWPYALEKLADEAQIVTLSARFNELAEELVTRLGSDGKMRLFDRQTEQLVALLDLTSPWPIGPHLEQCSPFPGLLKDEVTSQWEEFDEVIDINGELPGRKGPLLLTMIDAGGAVDFYGDRPPWEDGARPTRQLTAQDVVGGWYVDFHDAISAPRRTRVRGLARPMRPNRDGGESSQNERRAKVLKK